MGEPDSGLQFDRAEFEGNAAGLATCTVCQKPLTEMYYEIGGAVTCESCKQRVESEWSLSSDFGARLGRLARATAFGAAAAVAGCAVYYAVLAITGWEVGLISILVGVMVGAAVRAGARRRGGWLYQGLAMFLTYSSIVFSYVPLILKETDGAWAQAQTQGTAMMVITLIVAIPFLYAVPFMAGAENILGILIIGFGVYQAWKINKKETLQISGPYSLAARGTVPPPAPIQA